MQKKMLVLGVHHFFYTKTQLRARKRKKLPSGGDFNALIRTLQILRKKGASRLGVEALIEKLPPFSTILPKKRPAWRYFYKVCKEAKRMNYTLFNIEHIPAHQLGKIFNVYDPHECYAWIKKFIKGKKWESKRIPKMMKELEWSVDHYRTLLMLKNAEKLGCDAVIMGCWHAEFSPKKYDVRLIDKRRNKKKEPAPTFYSNYAYLIPPLLNAMPKSRLFAKLKKDWPAYTDRK